MIFNGFGEGGGRTGYDFPGRIDYGWSGFFSDDSLSLSLSTLAAGFRGSDGLAWLCLASCEGRVGKGGSAWLGLAWLGLAWLHVKGRRGALGLAWRGLAWLGFM